MGTGLLRRSVGLRPSAVGEDLTMSRSLGARCVVIALALVAIVGCGGGSGAPETASRRTTLSSTSTSTTVPRPIVGVVGDSLAEQVRDALPAAMPEADVHVEAVYGLTANDAIPATERLLAYGPAAVVVVLGTNDARDGATSGDDVAAVRRVVDRLQGVRCVRWVTVNESSRFPQMNDEARVINAELRRLASSRPGFAVVPWSDEIAQHPSWLMEDGLHHSEIGQAAFARELAGELRGCLSELESSAASSTTSSG
jgi:lysophospholipase L1-like esterase